MDYYDVESEFLEKLDDIKYWLKDVLKHLYDAEYFDIEDFENSLQELGAVVNLNIPKTDLIIEAKKIPQESNTYQIENEFLNYLLSINKIHAKELSQS